MGNRRTTKVPQIELVSDVIAREMDGHPDWQVAQWARELLDGEYLETDNGLPYTSHHRKGSVEFDRNIRALAAVLTWKKVPTDILVGLAMAIAPQTRTQAYPYGVTTRKWRICPTFKNVSGTQVGLTVVVVAFSALRAS